MSSILLSFLVGETATAAFYFTLEMKQFFKIASIHFPGLTVKSELGEPLNRPLVAGAGNSLPGVDLDAVAAMMKGGSSRGEHS